MSESDFSPTTFSGSARIAWADVSRLVWGDAGSGEVADWTYASTEKIHQLLFGLPPGGCFRHSNDFRTFFAADIIYYVLAGKLAMNNPLTGEVQVVRGGEAVFFRRDTWHHGHSVSTEPLRVLEYFAPPPAQGTSRKYALSKSNLTDIRAVDDQWLGRWPAACHQAAASCSLRVIRDADVLARLEGSAQQVLVELFVSTEHLTSGRLTILPGRRSERRSYGGDLAGYVSEGELFVRTYDEARPRVFELTPKDGLFVPAGVEVEFFNYQAATSQLYFGVAPGYVPQT